MKKLFILFVFLFSVGFCASQTNRLLFEGCTGTWCQYCPCGHQILEGLISANPTMLALQYHGGGGGDPWLNFNGNQIITLLGYTAYPRATIGRREGNLNRAYWQGAVNNQVNIVPPISFSFTHSYNTATRQLIINATGTALRNIDTATKITFVITESNLVYNQTSSSGCPPGGPTYVHKYVVRSIINGATGEDFTTGQWLQNAVVTKSCTTTVDNGWNAANCEIGTFVYFNTPGGVLNSQCYILQTAKGNISITGINNSGEVLEGFSLSQNYPNPFNPSTNIKFNVPFDGHVTLIVYDVLGNEVRRVVDNFLKAGAYNGGFEGSGLASGIYYYRLAAGDYSDVKKMTLIK